MDDVESHILSYPHLSAEEQREVEAYVESNPEWAPLLQDVRTLEGLSATVPEDPSRDALLASYVLIEHLNPDDVPSRLQAAFSRLEARVGEDEELLQELETARRRLKEAEAAMDPVSSFESLTAHPLEGKAIVEEVPGGESQPQETEVAARSVLDVLFDLPLLLQRGALAVLLLAGVYGGLYLVSSAAQSPLDRLAAVEVSDRLMDSYVSTETRSAAPESDSATIDQRYLEALTALRSARTSTLGLFPRYHTDELARAERLLEDVLDDVDPGTFLALEAHYYLGKISLAQRDVEAARDHLKTVVKQQGRKRAEATDILEALHEEAPIQDN